MGLRPYLNRCAAPEGLLKRRACETLRHSRTKKRVRSIGKEERWKHPFRKTCFPRFFQTVPLVAICLSKNLAFFRLEDEDLGT